MELGRHIAVAYAEGRWSMENRNPLRVYCKNCGAQIVFGRGEASETCDFCGGKLIRKELAEAERMPELIIPFFITPD